MAKKNADTVASDGSRAISKFHVSDVIIILVLVILCATCDYFCNIPSSEEDIDLYLNGIVKYDIIPMLEEYWFDDKGRYTEWARKLGDIFDE